MNDEKIIVLALAEAKADKVEEVKQLCMQLVEASRKEDACISYDCHQSKTEPAKFMFYEVWANQAGIDNHFQVPQIQEMLGKAQELTATPPSILFWQKLS